MSDILNKLGLRVNAVNDAVERCSAIADGLNLTSDEILKDAMGYLPEDLTNMVISALYQATKEAIEDKCESLGLNEKDLFVETDVNDYASQISVICGDDGATVLYDGDDIERALENAVWNHYLRDDGVKNIIEECNALMTEAGCGDNLNELADYARNYVESDYRYDEYDEDAVKEAFLNETVEWVTEQLESKGYKNIDVTYDYHDLYLNEEIYEADTKMLNRLCKETQSLDKGE